MAQDSMFEIYLGWLEDTESPLTFHRWGLVSAISTTLSKQLVFGADTALETYANQFIMLVGPPASRKNTAMRYPKKLLSGIGFDKFASDRSSKEKFIMDMQEGFAESAEDVLDMELSDVMEALIYAPELQDFLGQGNMDFVSFLTNMWDMPDSYSHRLKKAGSSKLINPTINLLGGATTSTLAEIFPENIGGQGFLSRTLMIYGKGARKKITFPQPPDPQTEQVLIELLAAIKTHARGHAVLTDGAKQMLDVIYKGWQPLPDVRLETYSGRRFTSLLKVCMVVASANLSFNKTGVLITEDHVLYANSMLCFVEGFMPRALGKLGSSKALELQNRISGLLEASPVGLSISSLNKSLTSVVENLHQLAEALRTMQRLGKVIPDVKNGLLYAGNSGPRKNPHCDYNLLKEGVEYYAELSENDGKEQAEEDDLVDQMLTMKL